jgi:phosphoglycolate phosphatase
MDAIIFDVDGTLWDSTPQVAIAWQMIAKNCKVPYEHITPERLHREFGKMMKDIAYSIFPDLSKEDALGVLKECMDYEVAYLLSHPPLPYDGVEQVFKYFNRKIPLFIVSNCQAGYIETFLETSDLSEYITCHLCPDDTGLNKAGNIKKIVDDFDLHSAVYVGDTMGDYNSAREAGVDFIYAKYGFGDVPDAPETIFKPRDLIRIYEENERD